MCGICYNRYTAKVRLPKLLTCSHTFCAPCIESYASGDTGTVPTSFACPVCRQETCLDKDGSAGLPNNFSLISLIEILQAQHGRSATKQSTSPKCISPQRSICSATSPDGSNVSSPRVLFELPSDGSELESSPDRYQQRLPCRNLPTPPGRSLPTSPDACSGGVVECQCVKRPPAFNPDYSSDTSAGRSVSVNRIPHSPTCPLFTQHKMDVSAEPIPKPHSTTSLSPMRPIRPVKLPRTITPPKQTTRGVPHPNKTKTDPPQSAMTSPLRRTFLSASMPFRSRVPVKPPRRSFRRSTSELAALKCVCKIGHYSDKPMTVNAFKKPTKVAVSDDGDIAVVDGVYMAVQLFASTGEHISMFTVPGASSVCFLGSEKVVIGTHRGIEIYTYDGTLQTNMNLESVVTVSVYKFGFIVCQPKQLTLYRASMTIYRRIKRRRYHSIFRRSIAFKSLCDITMTTQRDIAVLDGGSGKVYVLDQDGYVLLSMNPRHETCGQLLSPHSVTVDSWNSLYVSDTSSRRVLKFSPQGIFSRCVLSFGMHTVPTDLQARGLAASGDHLVVIVGGEQFAEIRVYTV